LYFPRSTSPLLAATPGFSARASEAMSVKMEQIVKTKDFRPSPAIDLPPTEVFIVLCRRMLEGKSAAQDTLTEKESLT
jgi:hypothetical protein